VVDKSDRQAGGKRGRPGHGGGPKVSSRLEPPVELPGLRKDGERKEKMTTRQGGPLSTFEIVSSEDSCWRRKEDC